MDKALIAAANDDDDDEKGDDDDHEYLEVENTLRRGAKAADGGLSRTNPLYNEGD